MNDISTVVITTTEPDESQDDWLAFGEVEVSTSPPEPGTFALILFGGVMSWFIHYRKTFWGMVLQRK